MSLADDFLAIEVELAALFGQSVTLTHVSASVYDPEGSVVQTTVDYTMTMDGPVSEASRYAASGSDASVTCTFYLPATTATDPEGVTVSVVPAKGDRITAASRVWQVISVETFQVLGTATSYRLDCGEVAA